MRPTLLACVTRLAAKGSRSGSDTRQNASRARTRASVGHPPRNRLSLVRAVLPPEIDPRAHGLVGRRGVNRWSCARRGRSPVPHPGSVSYARRGRSRLLRGASSWSSSDLLPEESASSLFVVSDRPRRTARHGLGLVIFDRIFAGSLSPCTMCLRASGCSESRSMISAQSSPCSWR